MPTALTPEEVLAETVSAAVEDRFPFESEPAPVTTPGETQDAGPAGAQLRPEAAPVTPPAPTISDLLDPDTDLYQPLPGRAEWYTMPNGKRVCVHPASAEEALWAQRQVLRELRREGLMPAEGATASQQREMLSEAITRGNVWATVAVCRRSEALDAPKIFAPKHANALRFNPGWAEACSDITKISTALGQGESEADTLRRLLAGFFDQWGSWLQTCVGPKLTARISSQISRCATCASSVKPPETRLQDLTRLLSQFPAE